MEEKTGRAASTIARLLLDVHRHPLPSGAVVIVDEASMVGTRDLARLAVHVATAGGALKLIGDPDQHGAEIGRAHVRTPVTNAPLVCRLLLEKQKHKHYANTEQAHPRRAHRQI